MINLLHPSIRFVHAGLFESERPWIHPERTETTYEIICVTQGEVCLSENGTEYALSKGQLLLLSPHMTHRGTRMTQHVGFYWVHFHLEAGELPFQQRLFHRFGSASLFRELLHYNNLPHVPHDLVGAILLHILCEMSAIAAENSPHYEPKAEKIYEWIRINATASLHASCVAEHFGYSPDHLTRICKRAFGIGVRDLLNRFLIARAKDLLSNTDKYVKEIAAELEFPSDKAFIGYFKYHEGCFPTEFRQKFSKLHMNSK